MVRVNFRESFYGTIKTAYRYSCSKHFYSVYYRYLQQIYVAAVMISAWSHLTTGYLRIYILSVIWYRKVLAYYSFVQRAITHPYPTLRPTTVYKQIYLPGN